MSSQPSRRYFLRSASVTAAGLGEWAGLLPLSPASAQEAKTPADIIRFSPDIEPIVRLIETTPRARCPEMMIQQLKDGLPYRQFLAGMYLAGLRNRALGGHHIAILHAASELALDVPATERLLPIFWALDSFKGELERRRPTATLRTIAGPLPAADKAGAELQAGMEGLDGERAERAVVALARGHGADQAIEALWPYAARDWVFIGHFAIWAANCWRTLATVGDRYAEPTLRYLVHEMIDNSDSTAKEIFAGNRARVRENLDKLPAGWSAAVGAAGLTKELVGLLRDSKGEDACRLAVGQLRDGKAKAGAVWDAVHVTAGEMVLRTRLTIPAGRPDAIALHANTVSEALHFAFRTSREPANKLLLLLQAVAWLGLFRGRIGGRFGQGILKANENLLDLKPADIGDKPAAVADEILAARTANASEAIGKAFALAQRFPDSAVLRHAAARLLPHKASPDAHDIKFPMAMFATNDWVSPEWRPHMSAAAVMSFFGSDRPDTELMKSVREAVRKL